MRWLSSRDGLAYCIEACDADKKGFCRRCVRPELHPDNAAVIDLFQAASTQRRYGMMGATGYDHAGVQATARGLGIEITPEMFRQFLAAERVWLKVLDDERPKTPSK